MATPYELYVQAEAAKMDLYAKPEWYNQVAADLERRHEGFRQYAYPDVLTPLFKKNRNQRWGFRPAVDILTELGIPASEWKTGAPWTVGIGFTNGVTPLHSMELNVARRRLQTEIMEHAVYLDKLIPNWKTFPVVVQGVLVNLVFNMGPNTFADFTTTLKMFKERRFVDAGMQLRKSKWYKQVGARGIELTNRLISGKINPLHKV